MLYNRRYYEVHIYREIGSVKDFRYILNPLSIVIGTNFLLS